MKHREHKPINYVKIAKLVAAGASQEKIAKAVDRYNHNAKFPLQEISAILSRMRTKGYRNEEGKLVKLKGNPVSSVAKKSVTKTTVKAAPKVAASKKAVAPSPVVVTMDSTGNYIVLRVPKSATQIPVERFQAAINEVVAEPVEARQEQEYVETPIDAPHIQPIPELVAQL